MSEAEISVNPGGASENRNGFKPKRRPSMWSPPRRSDVEWLDLFKQQRDSGLSLIEFCAPRRMSHTSFSAKRTKLMERYAISSFDDFDLSPMELNVRRIKAAASEELRTLRARKDRGDDDKMPVSVDQPRFIRVVVDGQVVVEIPTNLDPDWVAALILKLRPDCQD